MLHQAGAHAEVVRAVDELRPGADSRPRQRRSSSSRLKAIWSWGNSRLPSRCMRPASRRSVPSTMSTSASSPGRFSGSRPPCDERACRAGTREAGRRFATRAAEHSISDPARRNARRAGTEGPSAGAPPEPRGIGHQRGARRPRHQDWAAPRAPSAAAGAADVSAASLHSGLSIGRCSITSIINRYCALRSVPRSREQVADPMRGYGTSLHSGGADPGGRARPVCSRQGAR